MSKHDIDGQLQLFVKINSSLDDVDIPVKFDPVPIDPRDDPFSPDYESKVLCEIDDKYHPKKTS